VTVPSNGNVFNPCAQWELCNCAGGSSDKWLMTLRWGNKRRG
jgi:hypothetical protein